MQSASLFRAATRFSRPCTITRSTAYPAARSNIILRAMATTSAAQREWLVIIPDHENKIEKRIEIRPSHLERVTPQVEKDMVRIGGATLGAPLEEGKPPQMTGSAFVLRAETEQDVRSFLESDVYAKEGVWNLSKATIVPFRTAVKSSS